MTDDFETHHIDRKSLRVIVGSTADFAALAQDCVCFANGAGGVLLVGIEDGEEAPPADQRVDPRLLDRIRKRVGELTANVQIEPELRQHDNGGEYIAVTVRRAIGVASTADGRYFMRVGTGCQPVVGDDVLRLATDRPNLPWETLTALHIATGKADRLKVEQLCAGLRASDRVKEAVKQKTDAELLTHYHLAADGLLTNLGVPRASPRRIWPSVWNCRAPPRCGPGSVGCRPGDWSITPVVPRRPATSCHPICCAPPSSTRSRRSSGSHRTGSAPSSSKTWRVIPTLAAPTSTGGSGRRSTSRR